MTIQTNLLEIKSLIAQYEEQYLRPIGSVQLLAVSKGQSIEKINQAIDVGQRAFGENYLQEALEKMLAFANKKLEWHFIGKIQSNKTRKIAEHFDWVQSIDDRQIAKRLNDQRPAHLPPLNVCIEVNISNEATKSGIPLNAVPLFVEYLLTLPALRLRGLMASPAINQPVSSTRTAQEAFHQLFQVFQSLQFRYPALDTLSMGMSGDFEAAIAEGSTLIRIGTAIFGERTIK